ncbi:MAG TPA: hypothetical protein VGI19_11275, partial [Candidatus Cybelea sp.]
MMAHAMLSLSSRGEVLSTLARAHDIGVEAYTLHGAVLRAVEAAAQRGARVAVALDGSPPHDTGGRLAAENRRLARELRASGAAVTLAKGVHAKEIRADGELYLDEKNWDTGDLVVREDDYVAARAIPAIKHKALAREASLLSGARRADGVIVESESFGCCNSVDGALAALARAGAAPRLLVSERDLRGNLRERKAIEKLVRDGAQVRVCRDSEKLAVAGDRAWLGSANATVAFGAADCIDWGLCTGDAAIVRAVRDRLEAQWRSAKPYVASALDTEEPLRVS